MTSQMRDELIRRGFSRRQLLRAGELLSRGAWLPFYNEAALAQLSYVRDAPADAVMINANENPLGPCPEALAAMQEMLRKGGRYLFGEAAKLRDTMAEQEGLGGDHVDVFAGSSDPLHRAVLAFCGPGRPFVSADPGYEAGERAARFLGAPVVKVPLNARHEHDVKAMVDEGGRAAGVFYLCNPNNPTGTVTPRSAIEWLVANKPPQSIVLLDEAYIHFCDEPRADDLVKAGKDVIVLRTFSKIYGMAGLRAGAVLARPDLLEKLRGYGTGMLPATGMAGATASLRNQRIVPERKEINRVNREATVNWLKAQGFAVVPSVSNKIMVDVRRPGREVVAALAAHKVYIGRSWAIWPTHVRVTIGTADDMKRFQSAFKAIMG